MRLVVLGRGKFERESAHAIARFTRPDRGKETDARKTTRGDVSSAKGGYSPSVTEAREVFIEVQSHWYSDNSEVRGRDPTAKLADDGK